MRRLLKKYLYIADITVFLTLLVLTSFYMYKVFHNQTLLEGYDLNTYANIIDKWRNVFFIDSYPIMSDTAKIILSINNNAGVALAATVTLYNVLTIVVAKFFFEVETKKKMLSTFMAFALVYVSMLHSHILYGYGIHYRYLGVWSPNPWHSGSYITCKPFAIVAFILGAKTLEKYEEELTAYSKQGINYVKYILLIISMILVTLAKPSYTLIHGGAISLVLLYRLIKTKFRNIKATFLLGLCYLPTLLVLIRQNYLIYGEEAETSEPLQEVSGIGVELFRGWKYCDNIPLAIILAALFPFVMLIIHYREIIKNRLYAFSWEIYLVGLVSVLLLYETGVREDHCNMFWGYMIGLLIVYVSSLLLLINDTNLKYLIYNGVRYRVVVCIEWIFMLAHLLSGLLYFYYIYIGQSTN